MLHTLFKLRTCKLNLSKENVSKGKFKICLEYHIGNCLGPCEDLYNEQDYTDDIEMAHNILKGKIRSVKEYFLKKIEYFAQNLDYETAHKFKIKLEYLEKYHSKSLVSNVTETDLHVFSILHGLKKTFGNYIFLYEGTIIKTRNVELKNPLGLDDNDLLEVFVYDMQSQLDSPIKQILTNIDNSKGLLKSIQIITPKAGTKKRILDLSIKNVLEYKSSIEQVDIPDPGLRKLETLKEELHLDKVPLHIECFDNSNLQGTNAVASMVCFKNGKPSKKDYRHFNIKTVEGPNDFDSMREIVFRRYSRLKKEDLKMPDLIIVDGGKGQLSSAHEELVKLDLNIPIIGIAKKLEELYKPGDPFPLLVSKKSEGLKLIQHLRNEAHRFAINHHRDQRSKGAIKSFLDDIDGIGPKTKDLLLKHFKSIKNIKASNMEDIISLLGKTKGKKIYQGIKKAG